MKATYKDNPNKNLKIQGYDMKIRMHVFEPEESTNKDDWYKDMTTFSKSNIIRNFAIIQVGDILEDDMGARFRILSRHWKWEENENNESTPVIELTAERYIRRGKQNPYMI